MLLSIIIPTKNEEKYLPMLLDSIKAQDFRDYEIIVADVQSTDKTREIAEACGARIVPGGMPGPGRNKGAQAALGQVLLFLDADTFLPSHKFLSENLAEMKNEGVSVATAKLKAMSHNPLDIAFHIFYNAYTLATEKIRPHAPGSCIFAEKRVHQAIGGFDETVVFAEDHDYAQRAKRAGYKFRILRSQPICVSVRRLEKDGRFSIAWRYFAGELHMIFKGPIKKLKYEYKMGGDAINKSDE